MSESQSEAMQLAEQLTKLGILPVEEDLDDEDDSLLEGETTQNVPMKDFFGAQALDVSTSGELVGRLVDAAKLTGYQAEKIESKQISELILDRDYVLQDFLGEGGFGKVYQAIHRPTRQPVAVKFL